MAGLRISEPDVLTKLARPATSDGRTWHSVVQGFSGGLRRKRQEICVAVDGDSVSIYEIQNGRNLGSYSVPPDATFSCAPSSVRIKLESGQSERRTYCVIERQKTTQIQLHLDAGTEIKSNTTISTAILTENHSSVIEVVVLPDLSAVGVVFANGSYELLAADLQRSLTRGTLNIDSECSSLVAATFLSSLEASKSILKGRADIIASASAQSIFACGVLKSRTDVPQGQQNISYQIWCLNITSLSTVEPMSIVSHPLQLDQMILRDQDSATFISKTTRLILRTSSKLVKYDLTSTAPRRISEFVPQTSDYISSVDLSDNMLLCSSSSTIQLYNSAFRSLQAGLDLGRSGSKRKRGNSSTGPVSLLAYFPSIHRVIGIRRNHLVTVDILTPLSSNASLELHQTSLLLNNIGRGSSIHSRHKSHPQIRHLVHGSIVNRSDTTETWAATTKRLDSCATQSDGTAFETILFQHLEDMEQNATSLQSVVPEHKVHYVLSKVFMFHTGSTDEASEGSTILTIRFYRTKLFAWLAERGYLTPRKIAEALRSASISGLNDVFTYSNVVQALVVADSSLNALRQYLLLTPQFPARELCQTVKFIISMALANIQSDKMSSANTDRSDALVKFSNDQVEVSEIQIDALLSSSLARLAESDGATISRELRTTFERQDLIALIQFLRQKLYRAGYTRSVSNALHPGLSLSTIEVLTEDASHDDQPTELSLKAIIAILLGSIDAVGPLGLLNPDVEDDFTKKLIPELSSEILRATEAIDDAVFLRGVLRETLRYTETMKSGDLVLDGQDTVEAQKQRPGTIRTIYTTSATDKVGNATATLPITLRAEGRIDQRKVRRGDGKLIERSKREMGMLQDRLRGPYSLERLVL